MPYITPRHSLSSSHSNGLVIVPLVGIDLNCRRQFNGSRGEETETLAPARRAKVRTT